MFSKKLLFLFRIFKCYKNAQICEMFRLRYIINQDVSVSITCIIEYKNNLPSLLLSNYNLI